MATVKLDIPTAEWALPLLGPSRYKGAKGGRGSGKSHFFAEAAVEAMVTDPELRFVCIREVQRSLKFSAKALVEQKIRSLGVSDHFHVLTNEIRRLGGSGIMIFEGMQDHTADSIKSLEGFGRAWVEEAQSISQRSLDLLLPTIRMDDSEIWFSWNPDQPDDPIEKLLVEKPPPNAVVVHNTFESNPFCPDTTIQEAADWLVRDPDSYPHVWLGEYNLKSEAIVFAGKCVVEDFDPASHWDGPYHGCDFGFSQDPTTLVRCWINDRRLYIERESYQVRLDLDATPRRWQRDVPGHDRYVVRGDSSRPESISFLRSHGVPRCESAPKWQGSVEDGVEFLRQFDEIVIHPECKHAQDEARLYRYKVDKRTGDILPKIEDKHNHCLAGETLVDTAQGQVPIRDLVGRTGMVLTTCGPQRFSDVRMTSRSEALYRVRLSDGRSFRCTAEHMILADSGWVPAVALGVGGRIISLDAMRYADAMRCHPHTLSSTAHGTAVTNEQATTAGVPRTASRLATCTGMCGSSSTARYQTASLSTTRIKTQRLQTPLVSCACLRPSTPSFTARNLPLPSAQNAAAPSSSEPAPRLRSGTGAMRAGHGMPRTPNARSPSAYFVGPAGTAALLSHARALSDREIFALTLASLRRGGRPASMTFSGSALIAGRPSPSTNTRAQLAAPADVPKRYATVSSVEFDGYAPVYNMEVDVARHFTIEGGLVVHNCWDAVRYALAPLIKASGPRFRFGVGKV